MNKGFNKKDGKYMCICCCSLTFFSDNKRDFVCPECVKQSLTKYQVQQLLNNGSWMDIVGLRYSDDKKALKMCKQCRQNDVNHIYRVVNIIKEVLPLP